MLNINHTLNDDCLLQIFANCPLDDLMNAKAVCHRWHLLIELFICTRKRSLQLFGSEADVEEYDRSVVARYGHQNGDGGQASKRSDSNDRLLVRAKQFSAASGHLPVELPNIQRLTICYYYTMLELSRRKLPSFSLHRLLDQWHTKLRSLTLSRLPECAELQSQLWSSLSGLDLLRELHLFHLYEVKHIPPMAHLWSRLECLSVTGFRGDIVPVLAQLGPDLKELRLDYTQLRPDDLVLVLQQNPSFGSSLTRLTIGHNLDNVHGFENRLASVRALFRLLCENFKQLTSLHIYFPVDPPFAAVVPELAKLPRLSDLHLELNLSQLELNQYESIIQPNLPPLDALKRLHLSIYGYPTQESFALIPRVCPRVEEVAIKYHYRMMPEECLEPHINSKCLPLLRSATVQRYDQIRSNGKAWKVC